MFYHRTKKLTNSQVKRGGPNQVFLIYVNFSRLFLNTILYDLSATLQAERLAFRFYDALKIRSTGSFSFRALLQCSKYFRFAIVH